MIHAGLSSRWPGLRTAQLVVFQHIDHPPDGSRLTTLAERGQVSKQALIEVVDQLESQGFVERIADPGDRRAKLIRLTTKGMDVHEYAYVVAASIEAELEGQIGAESFAQLKHLLAELTDALRAEPHHGSGRP